VTAEPEKAPEPVKQEVVKPKPKPKAKAKPTPPPPPPPKKYVGEVYEKHSVEGEVEISRNKKTREDGSQYWEVEYSDGSMLDIDIE